MINHHHPEVILEAIREISKKLMLATGGSKPLSTQGEKRPNSLGRGRVRGDELCEELARAAFAKQKHRPRLESHTEAKLLACSPR